MNELKPPATTTSQTETTTLFRIENPNIYDEPDGKNSHADLVGQWFTPNLETATNYLRKSTQTFGRKANPVDGARLVIAQIPSDKLEGLHVSLHPVASTMDVEKDNYLIPRDGAVTIAEIPLDEVLDGLRGKLGNYNNLKEAKRLVAEVAAGYLAVHSA
jgi:hypothetical protein